MKKNKIVLIIIIGLIFLTTGCTKFLKDDDKKTIKNPTTGQSLTENIFCQPTSEETIAIYLENDIDIYELPTCTQFKPFSEYESIWTSLFVKPLAWFILFIGKLVKNYGVAIILITILIRLILFPVTRKTALQSENMEKAKPELDRLEKKYKNKTDQESAMKKSQEMMAIYKKHGISLMSGCLFAIIQIPLFFAFLEAINRLPALFEENLGPFQLGTSPITAFGNGQYHYAIFIILVIAATYFSFKVNKTATGTQAAQMKMMTNIMMIMIGIASFSISSGIALYWITNSGFTILQNLIVKRRNKSDKVIKV